MNKLLLSFINIFLFLLLFHEAGISSELKREVFFYWAKKNKYIKFHENGMEAKNIEIGQFKK